MLAHLSLVSWRELAPKYSSILLVWFLCLRKISFSEHILNKFWHWIYKLIGLVGKNWPAAKACNLDFNSISIKHLEQNGNWAMSWKNLLCHMQTKRHRSAFHAVWSAPMFSLPTPYARSFKAGFSRITTLRITLIHILSYHDLAFL